MAMATTAEVSIEIAASPHEVYDLVAAESA